MVCNSVCKEKHPRQEMFKVIMLCSDLSLPVKKSAATPPIYLWSRTLWQRHQVKIFSSSYILRVNSLKEILFKLLLTKKTFCKQNLTLKLKTESWAALIRVGLGAMGWEQFCERRRSTYPGTTWVRYLLSAGNSKGSRVSALGILHSRMGGKQINMTMPHTKNCSKKVG